MKTLNSLSFNVVAWARTNIPKAGAEAAAAMAILHQAFKVNERDQMKAKQQIADNRQTLMLAIAGAWPVMATAMFLKAAGAAAMFREEVVRARVVMKGLPAGPGDTMRQFFSISSGTGVLSPQLVAINQLMGTKGIADKLTNEQMRDFTETLAKFSVVANEDLGVAANNVGELVLQMRLFEDASPTIFKRVLSAIQAIGKNSSSNAKQVLEFSKSLSFLKKQNVEIWDIFALAGAARSFGPVSQQNLRSMFSKIMAAPATHGDALARQLGLSSVYSLQKLANETPMEYMLKLFGSFRGLSNTATTTAMKNIGLSDVRNAPYIMGASTQVDFIRKLRKLSYGEGARGTQLERDFAMRMNTLQMQLKRLSANINNIFIAFGSVQLGALVSTLKMLNVSLSVLAHFFTTGPGRVAIYGMAAATTAGLGRILRYAISIFGKNFGVWDIIFGTKPDLVNFHKVGGDKSRLWSGIISTGYETSPLVKEFLISIKWGLVTMFKWLAIFEMIVRPIIEYLTPAIEVFSEYFGVLYKAYGEYLRTSAVSGETIADLQRVHGWEMFSGLVEVSQALKLIMRGIGLSKFLAIRSEKNSVNQAEIFARAFIEGMRNTGDVLFDIGKSEWFRSFLLGFGFTFGGFSEAVKLGLKELVDITFGILNFFAGKGIGTTPFVFAGTAFVLTMAGAVLKGILASASVAGAWAAAGAAAMSTLIPAIATAVAVAFATYIGSIIFSGYEKENRPDRNSAMDFANLFVKKIDRKTGKPYYATTDHAFEQYFREYRKIHGLTGDPTSFDVRVGFDADLDPESKIIIDRASGKFEKRRGMVKVPDIDYSPSSMTRGSRVW